jgi:GDPmannose 4,6-dehydratase
VRDWGYAPEYVEGMWRMLQADVGDDYVLATGTATSVREFVEYCFGHVNLDWERHVRFDEGYLRPTEVDALIGDASKAQRELGWKATTMPEHLAHIMVDAELGKEPDTDSLQKRGQRLPRSLQTGGQKR